MTDREKLIDLLMDFRIVETRGKHVDRRGAMEQCADHLIAHGVTVREPQKPLTVEELIKLPEVVYIECSFFEELHAALPFDLRTIEVPCVGLQFDSYFEHFLLDKYGKTWRCWAEKPMSEERKAAEWEK